MFRTRCVAYRPANPPPTMTTSTSGAVGMGVLLHMMFRTTYARPRATRRSGTGVMWRRGGRRSEARSHRRAVLVEERRATLWPRRRPGELQGLSGHRVGPSRPRMVDLDEHLPG